MKTKIFILLVLLGLFYRLTPHLPNFSPIGAIALFSGFLWPKKTSWITVIVTMIISDIFLGFHSVSLFVYFSIFLSSVLGGVLKNNYGPRSVLSYSIISSLIFFLITNFGVWLTTAMYTKDVLGLLNSYYMGIPFLKSSLLSDIFFVSIFFAFYNLTNTNQVDSKEKIFNRGLI